MLVPQSKTVHLSACHLDPLIHRRPRVVYEIEDLNVTPIYGQFYSEELTPVRITSRTTYRINKILDKRVRRGIPEVLVIRQDYGPEFDPESRQLAWRISDMTSSTNSFYVTLFSNASREIYENTHADFTVKLSRPIDPGTSPNWEVGVCEVSCSSPPPASLNTVDFTPCADHAMIYCNIISPQFVADSTVRCIRTFPTTSCWHYEFRNVQYVPMEQRKFQFSNRVSHARGIARSIRR